MTNHTYLKETERIHQAYMRGDFQTAIKLEYLSSGRPESPRRPLMCEGCGDVCDCLEDLDRLKRDDKLRTC